jgi:hypothetical protein
VKQVGVAMALLQLLQLSGTFLNHPRIVRIRHGSIAPLIRRIDITVLYALFAEGLRGPAAALPAQTLQQSLRLGLAGVLR